jgi:hypothetical protein
MEIEWRRDGDTTWVANEWKLNSWALEMTRNDTQRIMNAIKKGME